MSGHAAAPPKAAPAPAAGLETHSVGRPVRDLAAEIYVQLISKVPDPGKAASMAKLSFKLAELFDEDPGQPKSRKTTRTAATPTRKTTTPQPAATR